MWWECKPQDAAVCFASQIPIPPATQLTFPQARLSTSFPGAPHFNEWPLDLTHLFSSNFSLTCTSQKLHKNFLFIFFHKFYIYPIIKS